MPINPYLAPQTSVSPINDLPLTGDNSAYRHGDLLVINKYYRPPFRCLFTGETPSEGQKVRKLQLTHINPLYLLFLFLGLLPGIIVMLIAQKKIEIHSYNGASLRNTLKKRRVIGGILLVASIVGITATVTLVAPDLIMLAILAGCVLILFSLALFITQPKRLIVKKYKHEHFFVKGVHESILALYPAMPDVLHPPR